MAKSSSGDSDEFLSQTLIELLVCRISHNNTHKIAYMHIWEVLVQCLFCLFREVCCLIEALILAVMYT